MPSPWQMVMDIWKYGSGCFLKYFLVEKILK